MYLRNSQRFIFSSNSDVSLGSCGDGCAVRTNFTIKYDSVATDEIVVLQNAIEDDGMIGDMTVSRVEGVELESEEGTEYALFLGNSVA